MTSAVFALVRTWLVLDFFSASRKTGQPGSTLTTTIFGQSFLALVIAAVLYPEYPTVPFAAANLSLSTLMVGMGYLGDTSRIERGRADRVLLDTSPLRPSALILARSLYAGFFICVTTIGMALPPAILLYWVSGQQLWVVPAYLVLACLVSSLAAGFLAVCTQLAHRFLGPGRAPLLAGTLRAAILAGGFVGFALCLPHLRGSRADLPLADLALLWPPYWAARFLHDPSVLPPTLLLASSLILFWIARLTGRFPPSRRGRAPRRGPLSWLDRRLAGEGPRYGITAFVSAMLYRSPGFRLRTLPLFGLPVAMVALGLGGSSDGQERRLLLGMSLQFPAIYLPFVVAFLPRADQPGAAWVFAGSPSATMSMARRASLVAVTTHLLLPVQVAALVLLVAGEGLAAAIALSCFSLGIGILIAGLHLRNLDALPFTEEGEEVGLDLGSSLGFALVLAGLGAGFSVVAGSLLGVGLGVLVLVVAGWTLTAGSPLMRGQPDG